MFAAWTAHRAGWKFAGAGKAGSVFRSENSGRNVAFTFSEKDSISPVPAVTIRGSGLAVSLTHPDDSQFIHGKVETAAGIAERLTPCPCRTPAELVIERLRRGCNTKLYFTLLETVRNLMAEQRGNRRIDMCCM
jgi:hypothetical protein